jgi:transglutaminase-like putative cysteine protease
MRIRVDHRTVYRYERPATDVVQRLRLAPRPHDTQAVHFWRVELDVDATVRAGEDAFGNAVHMVYPERPADQLTIRVIGEAEVLDSAGIVRGAPDPLPPGVYLRETALTAPSPGVVELAEAARTPDLLDSLHRLLVRIHGAMRFDPQATSVATPCATAWEEGHGVCQDFAHVFIAAARRLGAPARYVSGHLARDGVQDAAHAWAEACVPHLGWVGFDPANGVCTTDHHLRVAVGLDYQDAAPVRGARRGGGTETMTVMVTAAAQQ